MRDRQGWGVNGEGVRVTDGMKRGGSEERHGNISISNNNTQEQQSHMYSCFYSKYTI